MDAIGSLFAEERLKPVSVWNEYFLPIEENLLHVRGGRHHELYTRVFSPSWTTPGFAAQQRRVGGIFYGEYRSSMPLQMKSCANGRSCCCKVELNRGEFKTCSNCHSVWYCSVVCQKADWKRHKRTDCQPPSSSPSSSGK